MAEVRYEVGAPVVLHPASPGLWHIPRPSRRRHVRLPSGGLRTGALVRLGDEDHPEYLRASSDWPTYCGLTAALFVYAGPVRRRRACAVCRARLLLAEARPGKGVPFRARNAEVHRERLARCG